MNKSVLLVDDDKSILDTYQEILELMEYNVFTAENPYKALQIINRNIIHLAILDYNLPQMTGIHLGHLIKKTNESIKIMIFSGNPDIHEIARTTKYEICTVLTKPVNIENYIQAVKVILDNSLEEVSIKKTSKVLNKKH